MTHGVPSCGWKLRRKATNCVAAHVITGAMVKTTAICRPKGFGLRAMQAQVGKRDGTERYDRELVAGAAMSNKERHVRQIGPCDCRLSGERMHFRQRG